MVECLVEYGLPLQPAKSETLLVVACRSGHHVIAQFLLARGADPNHPSVHYNTHTKLRRRRAGSPFLARKRRLLQAYWPT